MIPVLAGALRVVSSAADEIFPLATVMLGEQLGRDGEEVMLDAFHQVDEAYLELASIPDPDDQVPARHAAVYHAERRSALLRLAARALAALAVDEAHRGEKVIAAETARLNVHGRLQ